ncbi:MULTISPECIES: ribosome-associated translation inhibitor RaiA [Muribaculaceae]|jgi:putative sigma-54 modulation protein|uniref:Ribosome-associated translation inhibitor RaiA n=2 Tax=Duncaniella TaxID=2518495 RepID=A0A4P7W3B9_9BACT|nr:MULTISPECIES: ribosome-associated translation inhibitor RaiA [Muribaculaceae]MBJ2190835.1 ribosome-associated translation inhibitor RaiA [Muribaculaceae bacterium]ROS89911.1 ribosome-associated translation inhibitor RaiA [Muribaculaceae bacterium Isolate-080 (Janvier)]HBN63409.1 ribosome-associated translation inhibitor RaiA [Porphyromonadaceae bacterium]MCX4284884.1 ribosome-associated translation inhibitor RaiA [Duncaniella dubosii]MDE6123284.1 ribosome-associated translation inhibitor Ra
METKINAIHFDISEKLTSFINKKIDKLTRRYPNVMSAEVSLRVVKPETALNKEAIVSLMVPQEPDQVATKTADTFEEAIDLCMEALDRQLEKVKNKK